MRNITANTNTDKVTFLLVHFNVTTSKLICNRSVQEQVYTCTYKAVTFKSVTEHDQPVSINKSHTANTILLHQPAFLLTLFMRAWHRSGTFLGIGLNQWGHSEKYRGTC